MPRQILLPDLFEQSHETFERFHAGIQIALLLLEFAEKSAHCLDQTFTERLNGFEQPVDLLPRFLGPAILRITRFSTDRTGVPNDATIAANSPACRS